MVIHQNFSLHQFNTFHIHALAEYATEVCNLHQLKEAIDFAHEKNLKITVLGGGSNVLFTGNLSGLIILNRIKGIKIEDLNPDNSHITAGSGEIWNDLVSFSLNQNCNGIENLTLIPGLCGAAPIQNIGAYGVELRDVFYQLTAYHIHDKAEHIFNHHDCRFAYRESVFKRELKNQFIITSITLKLNHNHLTNTSYGAIETELSKQNLEPTPGNVSKVVSQIRKSKLPDPAVTGNAGSFFKNPEIPVSLFEQLKQKNPEIPSYPVSQELIKVPAGWLIEKCGFKGHKTDHCGVHDKQALVLINLGSATGNEIFQLSEKIIESVYLNFEIKLEREVNILP